MKKKWGFTLLEVIIAVTCFFLLLVAIINIYSKMIQLKYNIQARTNVTQDSYFAIEKINLMLKDYTIDYEEYFNRKNVGCDSSTGTFSRDTGDDGYCNLFTAYGNKSNIDWIAENKHSIYFCSSKTDEGAGYKVIIDAGIQNGLWCTNTGWQSFGQYLRQFRDVKNDADKVPWARNDDDDENVMKWPSAIADADNTQELYLISQDGKSRIFFRRALVESWDRNKDTAIWSGDNEKRYTLQMLKLKWFDAGNNHNFNVDTSSGVYDGNIDTRACDYAQGFICNGSWIWQLYSWYKLASGTDDGWVNLFQKNITISNRNLIIYPTKNPQYALAENDVQINPYFTLNLTNKLYGQIRWKRLGMNNIGAFQINLQTTFNTKNFYTK